MGSLSLVITFLIFHSNKWAREFIKKGKKSFNLSYVLLKKVDFSKSSRLLKPLIWFQCICTDLNLENRNLITRNYLLIHTCSILKTFKTDF